MTTLEPNTPPEMWLFSDMVPESGIRIEVTDFLQKKSKNGKTTIPTLMVIGMIPARNEYPEFVGDICVSTWNISNWNELIKPENLGADFENWKRKQFDIKRDDKNKLKLVRID